MLAIRFSKMFIKIKVYGNVTGGVYANVKDKKARNKAQQSVTRQHRGIAWAHPAQQDPPHPPFAWQRDASPPPPPVPLRPRGPIPPFHEDPLFWDRVFSLPHKLPRFLSPQCNRAARSTTCTVLCRLIWHFNPNQYIPTRVLKDQLLFMFEEYVAHRYGAFYWIWYISEPFLLGSFLIGSEPTLAWLMLGFFWQW